MKSRLVIRALRSCLNLWSGFLPLFAEQNAVSCKFFLNCSDLSRLLVSCARKANLRLGSSIHASVIKNFEFHSIEDSDFNRNALPVWNSLLSMYSKCESVRVAEDLFDDMPTRDVVSWNIILSTHFVNKDFEKGFFIFRLMHEFGYHGLDKATLTTVLSACDSSNLLIVTRMIHCLILYKGCEQETSVGNSLITSYFNCGSHESGWRTFDRMRYKNAVSWTAMISGYNQSKFFKRSLQLFDSMRRESVRPNSPTYLSSLSSCSVLKLPDTGSQIHGLLFKSGFRNDVSIETALMDMYSKCGQRWFEQAMKIFESSEQTDEIASTVMLLGFARNGFEDDAIRFFAGMMNADAVADADVVSSVLTVFGHETSIAVGKQVHCFSIKRGFCSSPFVNNGLINMYSKCGNSDDSGKIFDRMPLKTQTSWNSMIAAFARRDGLRAVKVYEEMLMNRVDPTDVTFLSLLHACSHAGMVDRAMEILESMDRTFGILPREEHHACIVDALGRAGRLEEARIFIEELPQKPGVLMWQALLGACSFHGDCELGKYAADHWIFLDSGNPSAYVLLANIYSSRGRWKERAGIIRVMKELGLVKETGISSIEINKQVHSFVVDEKLHLHASVVHDVLDQLYVLMIDKRVHSFY